VNKNVIIQQKEERDMLLGLSYIRRIEDDAKNYIKTCRRGFQAGIDQVP
jgi:hypothetical protein